MSERVDKNEPQARRGERGTSLVEVLVALAILLFLMIGVLSMFSMAFLSNVGAMARTEMSYKAEQVADVVRQLNSIQKTVPTSLPSTTITGLSFPLDTHTNSVNITALTGSALTYGYWGSPSSTIPDAAGVLNPSDMRYTITVTTTAPNSVGAVTLTVAVKPNTKTSNATGKRYAGGNMKYKEVDYVTQLTP